MGDAAYAAIVVATIAALGAAAHAAIGAAALAALRAAEPTASRASRAAADPLICPLYPSDSADEKRGVNRRVATCLKQKIQITSLH